MKSQNQEEQQHPYLVLLEEHNITKEEVETFLKSKGWGIVSSYLSERFLEETNIVTANGSDVSNSRKLEAANKMGIIREVTAFPQTLLEISKGE